MTTSLKGTSWSRRLLLAGALALGVGGTAACSPTDNCAVRMDCDTQVTVILDGVRHDMTMLEAEVRGVDWAIERPATDASVCGTEPHLC